MNVHFDMPWLDIVFSRIMMAMWFYEVKFYEVTVV